MIIEVAQSPLGCTTWQLVAHVQKIERSMPRSVLEGLLRECVEHHLTHSSTLAAAEEGVRQEMGGRGVMLKRVEFRPLQAAPVSRPPLVPHFWEALVEGLVTADCFEVTLDVVVRALVAPAVKSNASQMLVLRSHLNSQLQIELAEMFKALELESLLAHRGEWNSALLQRLNDGPFDEILDQMHSEKLAPGHQAGLESLWVSDLKIQPREEAFRPSRPHHYADPFGHFYRFAHGNWLKQSEEL